MYTECMTHKAFTMLELLTVISIVGILTFMVLGNYNAFGGQTILRSLAYDMALSLREAQTFGVSVRRSDPSTFSSGYGIHYDTAAKNSYILFADAYIQTGGISVGATASGGDGLYRDPREEVRKYTMGNGYKITQLCVTTGTETCYVAGGAPHSLDIMFKRPEPDAQIRLDGGAPVRSARIELASPRGNVRSVTVEITGQISVK
jgi:prepilin-type N-terminal cleavage/methylation domain-containing protein